MEKEAAGGSDLLFFHFLRAPFPSSSPPSDADPHKNTLNTSCGCFFALCDEDSSLCA
jgi:hypothetical protein